MTTLRPALLPFAVAALLALTLAGCGAQTDNTTEEAPSPSETTVGEEATESDDVVVIGGDLASSTAVLLAETYAKGRDPRPTVEFLDATTVRFAFPAGLSEEDALGKCQIAYGVMSGEGVRVLIAVGSAEADCTAEIEG